MHLFLGGNFDVLSTEIFFAIVGAQYDQGKAAVLAMVLLCFTLGAFYAQRFWLGKKSYTTVSGKGDSGVHPQMPRALSFPVLALALIWAAFTIDNKSELDSKISKTTRDLLSGSLLLHHSMAVESQKKNTNK